MATWMFPLHVTVVILFLILLIFKTFLLLINNKALLGRIRAKTKLIEILLGASILVSGVYLYFITENTQVYFIAKIIIVILATSLGTIGLKKENKALAILSVLLFIYIYGISETKSITFNRESLDLESFLTGKNETDQAGEILSATQEASLQQGKVIYKVLCVECHGEDGKKENDSSANLATTELDFDEKIEVISNGKGEMRGYDAELSEQEIELVAAYTETLQE